ncbi:MAG: NTPase [Candidatus Glassbacteria bacterium]
MPGKNILITGHPGVGKTTVVQKISDELRDLQPVGFYTLEIREEGKRTGFKFVSLDGRVGILAHIGIKSPYRVGKYRVDREGFESFLDSLNLTYASSSLVLIDEIGKMECFSGKFISTIEDLLRSDKVVVATVASRGTRFIEEVKKRHDCVMAEVRNDNRDGLPFELAQRIRLLVDKHTTGSGPEGFGCY